MGQDHLTIILPENHMLLILYIIFSQYIMLCIWQLQACLPICLLLQSSSRNSYCVCERKSGYGDILCKNTVIVNTNILRKVFSRHEIFKLSSTRALYLAKNGMIFKEKKEDEFTKSSSKLFDIAVKSLYTSELVAVRYCDFLIQYY